ncbi:MAG TPA: hypothetical protein VM243_10980 [Phycisphaerae bacterium]|nr:hypothetical protein [Phycisphaerae bacterium]
MFIVTLARRRNLVVGLVVAALIGACRKEEPAETSTVERAQPAQTSATGGDESSAQEPKGRPLPGGESAGEGSSPAAPAEGALPAGHPPIADAAGGPKTDTGEEPDTGLPAGHPPIGQPPGGMKGAGQGMPPRKPPMGGDLARKGQAAPAVTPWAGEIDGSLTAAGIKFDLPDGWAAQSPASKMRLAQYELPGEAGPAELAVFCFGVGQGGSVQANISRWLAQFRDPDNPRAKPSGDVMSMEQNELKLSIVKAAGTFSPGSMGPMAPAQPPQPGYRLYGLIIEGGSQGNVFVKITGPAETIEAQSGAIAKFASSARAGK